MHSVMSPEPHIFEDADIQLSPSKTPKSAKSHRRIPSVGDVLRGRKAKENKPSRERSPPPPPGQAPLTELHINSPPQSRRVPLKDGDSRPRMHKKTGSSVSISSFMKGKDKSLDGGSLSSSDGKRENKTPQKKKSSTNLSGLLKKRSRKDLKTEDSAHDQKEAYAPARRQVPAATPIWAQFATQPVEGVDGRIIYPQTNGRSLEDEIKLYTPRDYSEFRPSQQRNFQDELVPTTLEKPPQRPFLEHKSSRSSIFTENIDKEIAPSLDKVKSRDQAASRPLSSKMLDISSGKSREAPDLSPAKENPKRSSRVLEAINTFNLRSRKEQNQTPKGVELHNRPLSPQELDSAFERVLDSLNIPHNMRDNMRNLKPDVKAGLVKGERIGSGSSSSSIPPELCEIRSSARSANEVETARPSSPGVETKEGRRSRSRSRPRSAILTLSKRDGGSPTKKDKSEHSTRSRSNTRPKSIDLTRPNIARSTTSSTSPVTLHAPDSATTPGDFIHYLREVQKPELVEVGKLHKLRILLRNESVTWTESFITKGGMEELVQLLYRITKVEWREDHEDTLLHETLLCLKALSTTSLALKTLKDIEDEFFPALLAMLFDEERKGPSEFGTRGVVMSLLFVHLSAAVLGTPEDLETRARRLLGYLRDPAPEEEKQPLGFISQMHISRPYRVWCKEVVNVTKEVFWIFLHNMNVIPIVRTDGIEDSTGFAKRHYPPPRPPHAAAPYVGGVEWEATQYISTHLDVLNGIIASLPTPQERNELRGDMRHSGWEKAMGGTLRTCKEKFYGGVHEGLKVWVAAATADGWPVEDVRAGPPRDASPKKSPVKKRGEEAPKIALDVGIESMPKMADVWV